MKKIVIGSIVVCLIWNIELVFRMDLVAAMDSNNETYFQCTTSKMFKSYNQYFSAKDILSELLASWFPMVTLVILNTVIFLKFKQQMRASIDLGADDRRRIKQSRQVATMVQSVSVAFIVCLIPISCYVISCTVTENDCYDIA